MTGRHLVFALCAVMVAGCGPKRPATPPAPSAERPPRPQVIWAPAVLQLLYLVQTQFEREIIFCLAGHWHGRVVLFVDSAEPTVLEFSSSSLLRHDPCFGRPGIVGEVHNHAPPGRCQFSTIDQAGHKHYPPEYVSAVTCGDEFPRLIYLLRGEELDFHLPRVSERSP